MNFSLPATRTLQSDSTRMIPQSVRGRLRNQASVDLPKRPRIRISFVVDRFPHRDAYLPGSCGSVVASLYLSVARALRLRQLHLNRTKRRARR